MGEGKGRGGDRGEGEEERSYPLRIMRSSLVTPVSSPCNWQDADTII